jgi:arabinofuranosyltransferase
MRWAATLTRERVTLLALSLAAGGVLALIAASFIAGRLFVDDMSLPRQPTDGLVDPTLHPSGIFPPEVAPEGTTFRWTGSNATFTFPYASNLGRHARLYVRLSAPRPPGSALPKVTLALNRQIVSQFTATPEMATYSATVDTKPYFNPYLEKTHLQLDIKSDTFASASDGRELGVMVDEVVVRMEPSRAQVALQVLFWALLAGVIAWVTSARYDAKWSALVSAAALMSFIGLASTYLTRGISPNVEIALAGLAWIAAIFTTPRKRPVVAVALAVCSLWLIVAGRVLGDWQMDDAYISYRYAWNLLHGNGLVYNPGEIVEGYTNFSWTLLAALALSLGLSPSVVGLACNIGLSFGLVTQSFILARRLWGGSVIPLVAAFLVAVDGSVLTYGARGSGMESIAFSFLIMLAAVLIWNGRGVSTRWSLVAAGAVVALAILTRPEGFLVAALFTVALMWQTRTEGRDGRLKIVSFLGPLLVVVVPYEFWRITFYGYLFPNTFYAKTGSTLALVKRGSDYVSFFLGERWLVVGMALIAIAIIFSSRRAWLRAKVILLGVLIVAFLLYVTWVGGDHFPGWRFLVPLVAPMAVLAAGCVRAFISMARSGPGKGLVQAGFVLVLAAYAISAVWLLEPQGINGQATALHTSYVNRWGSAGLWLRDGAPRDRAATTAAKGAGAIAFYSQQSVIDVYGLNDLHIGHLDMPDMGSGNAGHEKEDPTYVMDRKPEYILFEWLNYFQPVKGRLKEEYDYLEARAPTGPLLAWWKRKDKLER